MDLFVILFVMSIIAMVIGIKTKRLVATIFSTVLFLILAMQAFTLEFITSTGSTVTVQEIVLVYVNYLFAAISFIFTLAGSLDVIKNRKEGGATIGIQ